MRTLNLGIVAHVDAGKTSLTERLLHAAGVIDEIGSVDDGSTQTDSLALERQRGITIKAAVVSFVVGDVTINLIDTPGHPDFIAEVERVLSVLDGAVLVISAVEGVQPQARILLRTLQRLRIPTLVFVNKIDRRGADVERVLRDIAEKLTPAIVPMGSAHDLGTRGAAFTPFGGADVARSADLVEVLADHDDALLAAYLDDGEAVAARDLRTELAAQTKDALVHPVFLGSAITGAGVDALITGLTELLPAAVGDADGPVSGTVFKIERGPAGERIAYVRLFSGSVRTRDRLAVGGHEGKITAIQLFDRGSAVACPSLTAGHIGKLWGLGTVRIGDSIGWARRTSGRHQFVPPALETVVSPRRPEDAGALRVALDQLAEQDPLIDLRQDELRHELHVSLYGEVQKEVIQQTLATDFGVDVEFRETTTICIEQPIGAGAAVELIARAPNPFLATVGLRVEPAPVGSGVDFRLEVELGSIPLSFHTAVEDTVRETLHQGLQGWEVTDCAVTLTHTGYYPRQSHAHQGFDKSMSSTGADFRHLTPLVLMSALRQAGTTVYEPVHRFHLEVPADTLGSMLPVLARLHAVPDIPTIVSSTCTLTGEVPAAKVHELRRQLPGLSRGEGLLESAFDSYRPVRGTVPSRPRTDANPLDRKEYLLHVLRRV
ncbi:MAG: TetM/TetW/TetO/TetS family tetracycline resistance ribosomal protection protein [Acidimicrobiia bacterium]|nr:TetM/TetW/TetO/TetS family tetracycline resistance ribosomal protection protein [Acidimicrobiia bacterium]